MLLSLAHPQNVVRPSFVTDRAQPVPVKQGELGRALPFIHQKMLAAIQSVDTYGAKARLLIKINTGAPFLDTTPTDPRGSTDDCSAFPVPDTFMAETAVWSMGIRRGQLLCNTAYIASP